MTTPGLVFNFPADSTITTGVEYSNFLQLEADANAEVVARFYQDYDTAQWNALEAEIGALVTIANLPTTQGGDKSAIYDQIMIIITAQYLPTVSNFLGDQIYEQAAIQDLSSDVSNFLADGQNGYNALSSASFTTGTPDTCISDGEVVCDSNICCTSDASQTDKDSLFQGVSILVYGQSGVNSSGYNFSFSVNYTHFDDSFQLVTTTYNYDNVIEFLTDSTPDGVWGGLPPLSSDGGSQISTALLGIVDIFNSGVNATEKNSWLNEDLTAIANAPLVWAEPYGVESLDTSYGPENAPLVYTEPNSIQQEFNQATQAVQTVATSTQTIQNFQIQEIDQFYGITNSIQSSQQQQCSAMVKHQLV